MANDAKFNFYLNRQGARGQRGEKGDQGFSPSITVNTNTADEYTLLIQNEYDSLVTDNIRPTYDDRGGTYVRVDRANNVQYFGSADIATTANYGEVKLAQASDLASTVDVGNSNVITAELLKTWFDGQVADNLVTTTNNVTIQGQKVFATPTRFMDTVRIGNRLMVTQDDTGTITFDSDNTGTLIGTHLTSTGDARFTKNVTVDGIATIEGGLNVAGNAVISNPQLGNTTISGDLTTNADINIQGQKVHLQHTNPTMYLKNINGVNEIEIFRGLFTAGNPSPADNYLSLGHSQLQLNLTGKAIKANGKDVATADTVEAIQSDLNIAKQDIIEAQSDIDNLQMNKQNKLTAGSGITIDADNVISATGGVVDLPIASSTTLGGIKVGENLTISEDGTLSATGGGGGSSVTYTAEAPLSISADNVISIDTTDLGGTTIKKDASINDYALDLTANGTVGGTSKAARAESNESGHDAYMAFSGHNPSDAISTLWGPIQRKTDSWVELYLPDGVVPYSAAWTYGSTNEILPAVELLASNDGSSYTSLGSVEGVSTDTASMTFNTTDSYKYLRFKFRDACVASGWGKFGLTSLKVKSSEVATYTELFIGDNIDVTNGVMNVNLDEIGSEVNSLSGEVNTLSGEVAGLSGDITTLQNNMNSKQDKLTAGKGLDISEIYQSSANNLNMVNYPNSVYAKTQFNVTSTNRELGFQYLEGYIRPDTSITAMENIVKYGSILIPFEKNFVYVLPHRDGLAIGYMDGDIFVPVFPLKAFNSYFTNYDNTTGSATMKEGLPLTDGEVSVDRGHGTILQLLDNAFIMTPSGKEYYKYDISGIDFIQGKDLFICVAQWGEWNRSGPNYYLLHSDSPLKILKYDQCNIGKFATTADLTTDAGTPDANAENLLDLNPIKQTIISSTTPITYLTRAQYDALETKDANTMYVITDEEGGGSENDTIPLGWSTYQSGGTPSSAFLASLGQQNNGTLYPTFYNTYVAKIGQAFGAGFVKAHTASDITDYDLVINQDEQTFRLPLIAGRVLVESKKPTVDDPTWYNLYSDGWLEQGGLHLIPSGSNDCNLLKAYKDNNYTITIASTFTNNTGEEAFDRVEMVSAPNTTKYQKTDKFRVVISGTAGARYMYWNTRGYADRSTISTDLKLYYKVSNAVQNLQLLDVAEVTTALANKQDKCIHIIDTYVNGTSGYRIWSDGYCEQWGEIGTPATINFVKTWRNTDYIILGNETGGDDNARAIKFNRNNRTVNSIRVIGSVNPIGISWKASGYLASDQY